MSKKGILLVNLGSPDSTSVADVRKYLKEFLMDGRVLDAPFPIRWFVVNCLILPKRPAESAEAYEKVWTEDGSPLISISREVQKALQAKVGDEFFVELAMRYQSPSIEGAIESLKEKGIDEVVVVPLFPHYAMSSYESAVERVKELMAEQAPDIGYKIVSAFYDDPEYIEALAEVAKPYLEEEHDHLLFSFHGLPERHLRVSDPTNAHCLKCENCCEVDSVAHHVCYRAQCYKTVKAFTAHLGIPEEKYSVAFQSRLGRDPWLKPYSDMMINEMAKSGMKKLLVMCPAFVSDCLETIEEIGMQAEEDFTENGGESLKLIPCLNTHEKWIDTLEHLVRACEAN